MGDKRRLGTARHTSTRIIAHRETTVDGVQFRWWAVGEHPALVTVRSAVFGAVAEFTYRDIEQFAHTLAKKLLAQHYQRAAKARVAKKRARTDVSPLKKAGWFESEPDFQRTVP